MTRSSSGLFYIIISISNLAVMPLGDMSNVFVLYVSFLNAFIAGASLIMGLYLLRGKDQNNNTLNDHLEEGCNERDKELVELREQYANSCQTIADLQVKYGEAMSELNKLKHPF